jgi:hypothetical protein
LKKPCWRLKVLKVVNSKHSQCSERSERCTRFTVTQQHTEKREPCRSELFEHYSQCSILAPYSWIGVGQEPFVMSLSIRIGWNVQQEETLQTSPPPFSISYDSDHVIC